MEMNEEHQQAFKKLQEAMQVAAAAEAKAREALKVSAEVEMRAHIARNALREVQLRLTATSIGMLRHIILNSSKDFFNVIAILQKNPLCPFGRSRKQRDNFLFTDSLLTVYCTLPILQFTAHYLYYIYTISHSFSFDLSNMR